MTKYSQSIDYACIYYTEVEADTIEQAEAIFDSRPYTEWEITWDNPSPNAVEIVE